MKNLIYRVHIWTGLIVSVPVFAWALSGFLNALPNNVEGGTVDVIDISRVRVPPDIALSSANRLAGRKLPVTALTLLMRNGRPYYQAVGGLGADSILIDAESGKAVATPKPNLATRFFVQAHFYSFAGSWQIYILLLLSAVACVSSSTGLYLGISYLPFTARFRKSKPEDERDG